MTAYAPITPSKGMFSGEAASVARIALDVINDMSRMTSVAPTTASLQDPKIHQEITRRVEAQVSPRQADLLPAEGPGIADIVQKTVQVVVEQAIDIPRILVKPKCAYTYQKFQSDTERVVALILERDALRWLHPIAGQFNIFYRNGAFESEYVPDFVALTDAGNLLIETKAARDMESADVKAKAEKATLWCKHASEYSLKNGGKPWKYLLIPHDEMGHSSTLAALVVKFTLTSSPSRQLP